MSQPVTDRVYHDICDLIRSGEIAPGARIPNERKLAEMKGASRTQVRDALLMLQKEGLVERKIGSGTYLSERAPQIIELKDAAVDMSPERSHDFLETLEARLLIEPSIAARAAEAPTKAFRRDLDASLKRILAVPTWLAVQGGDLRLCPPLLSRGRQQLSAVDVRADRQCSPIEQFRRRNGPSPRRQSRAQALPRSPLDDRRGHQKRRPGAGQGRS